MELEVHLNIRLVPSTLGQGTSLPKHLTYSTSKLLNFIADISQTCQLTPIKSVTHAFDVTHTLTHIHNSFTRIPQNLAARLKRSIMYTNLLTDMLPHVIDLPHVASQ